MSLQIAIAFFTNNGSPLTGPANLPTTRIRRIDTQALVVTDLASFEIGDGNFGYIFDADPTLNYSARMDGDPTSVGQVTIGERYKAGGFSGLDGVIAEEGTVAAGSSSTEIRSTISAPNDRFNNMQVVVEDGAGHWVARNINDYANTNGAFTVDDLGFSPTLGDRVLVLALTGSVPVDPQAIRDAMKLAPTAGAPAVDSVDEKLDNIETDTSTTLPAAITTSESNIRGAQSRDLSELAGPTFSGATDSLELATDQRAAIQTSVDDIGNNTRFSATIPTLERPSTGAVGYRIRVNLEDTNGNPEDPDETSIRSIATNVGDSIVAPDLINMVNGAFTTADINRTIRITGSGAGNDGDFTIIAVPSGIQVQIAEGGLSAEGNGFGGEIVEFMTLNAENNAGASRNSNLDSLAMRRIGVGRYENVYTVADTHLLEQLLFEFSYAEGGVQFVKDKTETVVDASEVGYTSADRTRDNQIAIETAAILVDTNEIQGKLPTNFIMGSGTQTDKDDEIDAILADTAAMEPLVSTNLDAQVSLTETAATAAASHAATQSSIAAFRTSTEGAGFVSATDSLAAARADRATRESNIRGTDSDDLKDISDQIDALSSLSGQAPQIKVSVIGGSTVPTTVELLAVLERNGELVTAPTSATIGLKAPDGTPLIPVGAMTGPNADGVFRRTVTGVTLSSITNYYADCSITDGVGTVRETEITPTVS